MSNNAYKGVPNPKKDSAYACELNVHYSQSIGWGEKTNGKVVVKPLPPPLDKLCGLLVDDPIVAISIFDFQTEFSATHTESPLVCDGVMGNKTFSVLKSTSVNPVGRDYIVLNKVHVPVDFKVISFDENGGYSFYPHRKNYRSRVNKITAITVHWDAALSAISCFNILLRRNFSTHFCVDVEWDGKKLIPVVYQFGDPSDMVTHHGGFVNGLTIGIDMSNAVDMQFQSSYVSRLKVPRPVVTGSVHGDKSTILGFYPEQKACLKSLCHALMRTYNIKPVAPTHKDTISPEVFKSSWSGVMGHLNLTTNKWDPGPEWPSLVTSIVDSYK